MLSKTGVMLRSTEVLTHSSNFKDDFVAAGLKEEDFTSALYVALFGSEKSTCMS